MNLDTNDYPNNFYFIAIKIYTNQYLFILFFSKLFELFRFPWSKIFEELLCLSGN